MKRKILNLIPKVLVLAGVMSFLTGCSLTGAQEETVYLKIYNSGDYIYTHDPDNGYEEKDLTEQFVDWINLKENKETYFGKDFNKRIDIIYDMYDTNETMYNELKTGKSSYDLICPSDYMIQKLAKEEMIQKVDRSKLDNYFNNSSPFLTGEDGKLSKVIIDHDDLSKGTMNDYGVGYFWGTLGLMFNPGSPLIKNRSVEEVIEDFTAPNGWDALWEKEEHYKGVASIKDSIRDCYALGILHGLKDQDGQNQFAKLYKDYDGNYDDPEYNLKLTELFNRCDDETIKMVEDALIALKDNIYGFEVDTGKTDIVTGKVAVNLAWSGDAVFSMDTAEEVENYLYYTIPSYGANIWFDGWSIPSSSEGDSLEAAYAFLDFLAIPSIAAMNMDYVGYTSFIAGDEVLGLVHEWYDGESEDLYPYDLSYFFDGTLKDGESDPVVYIENEQLNRQMRAQYPLESDLNHLVSMEDFGARNDAVVLMWENVRVNPLPLWISIFVISSFAFILVFLGSYKVLRKVKLKKRKALRLKK